MSTAANGESFEFQQAPTPEEAAAVIAAIERFLADTASAPAAENSEQSGWLRGALHDAVGLADEHAVW